MFLMRLLLAIMLIVVTPMVAMNTEKRLKTRAKIKQTDAEVVSGQVTSFFGCLASACLREDISAVRKVVNSKQFRENELLTLKYNEISPLHIAVANDNRELIEILLAANLLKFLPVRDIDGRTCLHCGVAGGNIEVLKLLLEKLKDQINYADDESHTALYLAQEQHKENQKLVKEELAQQKENIERARNSKNIVKLLIQHGAQREPTKREKAEACLRVAKYTQELSGLLALPIVIK